MHIVYPSTENLKVSDRINVLLPCWTVRGVNIELRTNISSVSNFRLDVEIRLCRSPDRNLFTPFPLPGIQAVRLFITFLAFSSLYHLNIWMMLVCWTDLLCGLVVRLPGCRYRGPGFDSWRYQIFWVTMSLERGPLILARINEELLEGKISGCGLENRLKTIAFRCPDHTSQSSRKIRHYFVSSGGRSVGITTPLAD
jgi:hypothetical protein